MFGLLFIIDKVQLNHSAVLGLTFYDTIQTFNDPGKLFLSKDCKKLLVTSIFFLIPQCFKLSLATSPIMRCTSNFDG